MAYLFASFFGEIHSQYADESLRLVRSMDPQIKSQFDEFIKNRGLRRTGQRDLIVEAVFSSDEHFTAEELWIRTRKLDPKASRATVYRTISLLEESGLLREIDMAATKEFTIRIFSNRPITITSSASIAGK